MEKSEMKKLATEWYSEISTNEMLYISISKKFPNTVVLKVFNSIFNSTGNIWVKFIPEQKVMCLCSEIGTHSVKNY